MTDEGDGPQSTSTEKDGKGTNLRNPYSIFSNSPFLQSDSHHNTFQTD